MRPTVLLPLGMLLLLPLAAAAADRRCEHQQPRSLDLDLAGGETIVFDIGNNELDVRGGAGKAGKVRGKACASDADDLPRLRLTQEKRGDALVVRAERENGAFGISFGNRYAYQVLQASVPAGIAVRLEIGSGDGRVEGVRAAEMAVGSGDGRAVRIQDEVTASVGSGDVDVEGAGTVRLRSVGSGDAQVRGVRGATRVGSVGSGDLAIRAAHGPVGIGSIGSGDVELADIGGSVTVDSIGSGDLRVGGVRGDLTVHSIGSGDVDHDGVAGRVDLPRRD